MVVIQWDTTPQVPCRKGSTRRLLERVLNTVIRSGQAVSGTVTAFRSWRLVQQVIGGAALRQPDVDVLAPGMLGVYEYR
jgi:hypothetical protein